MADGKIVVETGIDDSGIRDGVGKLGSLVSGGAGLMKSAIGAATGAFSSAANAAISVGSSFEEGMSKVSAISGASGEDLSQLTEKAKEMGASTKFSATESAAAMEYMAMAGWKTNDMLGGIEGIMNLAAASGEDLATTSDIVTDALTAFGLSAQDSTHFADVLAATSSNANTNVSMLGETFKYCAPVAGALGFSVEDTAEAIGLMANSGIKASQAGTTMRSTMTALTGDVTFSSKALGDVSIQTKNADGSMRDLNDILGDCREAFSQMSDSEKSANAEALVGKNAMSGFLALMNAAPGDIEKLNGAIANCDGSAASMAETMNDNLNGAVTILKSSLEGLGIELYEGMADPLKDAAKQATEYVGQLTDAFKNGGLDGLVAEAGNILGEVVTKAAQLSRKGSRFSGAVFCRWHFKEFECTHIRSSQHDNRSA